MRQGCDDTFSSVSSTTTFNQVFLWVDFVGTINREIQLINLIRSPDQLTSWSAVQLISGTADQLAS